MAFFSGLRRPAGSAEHFLAALRDRIERDRRLAAQAMRLGDPAETAQILARSRAVDAQRAEAKERSRQARMAALIEKGSDIHGAAPFEHAGGGGFRPGQLRHPGPGDAARPAGFPADMPRDRHAMARQVSSQAGEAGGGIPKSVLRQGVRVGGKPIGGTIELDSRDVGGRVTLDPPHPAEDRAGRVGEGLGAAIRAAFEPQAPAPAPTTPAPWRPNGRWAREEVERRAANAMRIYDIHIADGMGPEAAAGWAANAEAESHGDHRSRQAGGAGFGLFHWDRNRRRDFEGLFGFPMEQSTLEDQLKFRDFELLGRYADSAKLIARSTTAGDYADAITRHYERPGQVDRDAADRANVAEAISRHAQSRNRPRQR